MGHFPINHHLRPLYRALAGLAGVFLLVLGVIGVTRTSGLDAFAREDLPWIFGMRVNPAFAWLSIILGAVVVLGAVLGRNIDYFVNWTIGVLLMVLGTAALAYLQTDANILAFSMTNVIGVYLLAIVIFTAGLYSRVGDPEKIDAAAH